MKIVVSPPLRVSSCHIGDRSQSFDTRAEGEAELPGVRACRGLSERPLLSSTAPVPAVLHTQEGLFSVVLHHLPQVAGDLGGW